jgi:hypothetical protein
MNILPGLRELRAPLASGYLWLVALWLALSHAGWLPSKRPPGNGEVARLWDLGGTLGKTTLLAAVTFIAYLIGSFLELDPSGPIVIFLGRLLAVAFAPFSSRFPTAAYLASANEGYEGDRLIAALPSQARVDLRKTVRERGKLPQGAESPVIQVTDDSIRAKERENSERAISYVMEEIVEEMPQLASRLLVKNKELYGRYDRLMAEATLRINVSIPLTVVLALATWLSSLPILLRAILTIIIATFGFLLLRQGILRARSARAVIVQALAINEVDSRYLDPAEQ